jgi:hypothetical protein
LRRKNEREIEWRMKAKKRIEQEKRKRSLRENSINKMSLFFL